MPVSLSNFTSIALLGLGSYLLINRTLSIGQLLAYNGLKSFSVTHLQVIQECEVAIATMQ
jgi:ABC-type bacteriocin/lantibiotic exporter with double-glycine peptidase domain